MTSLFSNMFHIFFNTVMIFFLLSLFIEFILFACRIKNSRIKTFFRLLPLIKIPLDILLLKVFYMNSFFNLNPFSCEYYLLKKVKQLLPFEIFDSPAIGFIFLFALFFISLFFISRKIVQLITCQKYLKHVFQSSTPYTKPFGNQQLDRDILKAKAKIMISPDTHSPFATLSSHIVIPQTLMDTLSQEEFEAVVAHELGHLHWKDPHIKLISQFIGSLFWWIPLQWWLKKLELDQEEACDQAVYQYGIDTLSLASAIVKTISIGKEKKRHQLIICPMALAKNVHINRLKNILDFKRTLSFNSRYVNSIIATASCMVIFFTWWIC